MPRALHHSVLALLATAVAAGATVAAQAQTTQVDVRLHPIARVDDGGVVTGRARVSCPAGVRVLEALVTISQESPSSSGQGAIRGVRCTGTRGWYDYIVSAHSDDALHPGPARVSGYVLVVVGEDTASGGDSRVVRVR